MLVIVKVQNGTKTKQQKESQCTSPLIDIKYEHVSKVTLFSRVGGIDDW